MARGRRGGTKARDYSQIVNGYGYEDLEKQKRLLRIGKIVRQFRNLRRREKGKTEDDDDNHIITIINKTLTRLNKLQKKFHEEDDSEETKQPKLRINSKILRRLNDKLKLHEQLQQDDEAQKKQMTNKILSRLWKLLHVEAFEMRALGGRYERTRVCYDRQSTNCYTPEVVKRLILSANLAVDFFNKTSPIIYSVVDVVYATKYQVAGYRLNLTFTAKHGDDEDPKTFRARIYYGIKKPPEVKFVEIVVAT